MDKKKIIIYVQAALYILWIVLMAASAIVIFRQGTAYQAQGHPEVWIYTREKAVAAFLRLLPLLLLAVAVNIVAVVIGARDEKQDKPQALPYLTDIYKAERAQAKDVGKGPENDIAKAEAVKKGRRKKIRLALYVLAVVFVVAGIFNGSMEDMLIKAINICTECIGLG